ncbi:antibiotic biosynthesis monooxygenase family protein [Nostoc sp.]|uniref:antibiotic biosynthesis monooxygenase family protein n=1 Tax=Nostoc sp. TaxID=1180 RepID=UPI002FF567DA
MLSSSMAKFKKAFMDSPVVLINVFSIPQGLEDEFLRKWNQTALLMKNEPGFIDTGVTSQS